MPLIKRICYVCGKVYGYKEALWGVDLETHGLCEECFPKELKRLEKESEKLKNRKKANSD